ncbi:MAG: urea transporter [Motiliproteus sp.]
MGQRQSIEDYLHGLFTAFGQIFFQNNALCGLYVIGGIALNSLTMLVGGLLGAAVAQFVAGYLIVDDTYRREGGYGFNGALLGLACSYFYPVELVTFGLIVLVSLAATLLQYYWQRRTEIACYTAPFVVLFWLLLALFDPAESIADSAAVAIGTPSPDLISAIFNSLGQVCFQQNPISGLLFWVGISLGSLRAGLWVIAAGALSTLFGWLLGLDSAVIESGFYGFNPVLLALGCLQWKGLRQRKELILVLMLLIALSLLLMLLFKAMGVVAVTAPFVLSLWLVSGCVGWSRAAGLKYT